MGKAPGATLDFSSNDYLLLSRHPATRQACREYASTFGIGATGSRLLSGDVGCFSDFEKQIAQDKGCERALLFPSGYQANVSVLSALLDPAILKTSPLVFFDKYNHASLYQAVFLSKARLVRYPHGDLTALQGLLEEHREDAAPKFIVSETLFGMDGDVLDLAALMSLAKAHQALVYLDEAHASGILGTRGYGLYSDWKDQEVPTVVMGTFSKALGGAGAYVATSSALCDFLINRCSGFIYSTAPFPPAVAAAQAAWGLLPSFSLERAELIAKGERLRCELQHLGLSTGSSSTHIVPIILGEDRKVMEAKEALLAEGICVSAVRSPTVPPGMARLRVALNLGHSEADRMRLVYALKKVLAI